MEEDTNIVFVLPRRSSRRSVLPGTLWCSTRPSRLCSGTMGPGCPSRERLSLREFYQKVQCGQWIQFLRDASVVTAGIKYILIISIILSEEFIMHLLNSRAGAGCEPCPGTPGSDCTSCDDTPDPAFSPPCDESGHSGLCSGNQPSAWGSVGVVDTVLVPDLTPGQYVLQWRMDCEATAQVWTNCADIRVM